MKKFLSIAAVLLILVALTACSSNTTSTTNPSNEDADLAVTGQWVHEGADDSGKSFSIEMDLEDDGKFEIVAENDVTEGDESTPNESAQISGTYTEYDGTQLVLKPEDGSGAEGILPMDFDKEYELTYEITTDEETLKIKDGKTVFLNMPDELDFGRIATE